MLPIRARDGSESGLLSLLINTLSRVSPVNILDTQSTVLIIPRRNPQIELLSSKKNQLLKEFHDKILAH